MASNTYTSVPIDAKSREIRLIELVPSHDDQRVSCKFHRHTLDSLDLEYTAVSYTWGDPKSPSHDVLVDGNPFRIRQNLWHFLKQEREAGHKNLLWIDALCIDQSNMIERNHQVALMRDIYSMVRSYILHYMAENI
jgi:hypothetical protein